MSDEPERPPWPSERHAVPDRLRAGEPYAPGTFAYMVDPALVPADSDGTPPSAIAGCYPIGPDGRATGEFLRNPDYVPAQDDVSRLQAPELHLEWLGGPPSVRLRAILEDLLGDLELVRVHVVDGPRTVMRGETMAQQPDLSHLADPEQPRGPRWNPLRRGGREQAEPTLRAVVLTDAGLAAAVTLWVHHPDGRGHLMHGIFTLVRTHLSTDHHGGAVWLEPDSTLDQAEAQLEARIDAARADRTAR